MAKPLDKFDSTNFFDILIDRLIDDVRREFEESQGDQGSKPDTMTTTSPVGAGAAIVDDLVAKMVGYRLRLAPQPNISVSFSPASRFPRKFQADVVESHFAGRVEIQASPQFTSSVAQSAFALATRLGAKFVASDLATDDDGEQGLTRESLKRERRRVLLSLHPDRQPEKNRIAAHEAFLSAAEAFTILAENATARPLPDDERPAHRRSAA